MRLGSVQNLYAESIVHENYVSDMIKAYGTDIRYFKMKTPYPDVLKPILDSNNLAIHAYGEGDVQEWEDPVRMIAFLKWDSDSIILNAYGVQLSLSDQRRIRPARPDNCSVSIRCCIKQICAPIVHNVFSISKAILA